MAIPNYKLVRVDRLGKGGGGVALFIHDAIQSKCVSQSLQPPTYVKRPEFLFVQLSLSRHKLLLGVVYNPPKCGYWSDVDDALLNCNVAADYTIVLGDFNINFDVPSTSRSILISFLQSSSLSVLPFHGTHHVGSPHSTIDYFCVSDATIVKHHEQLYIPHVSQHDALIAELSIPLDYWVPRAITSRCFRHFDYDSFTRDLLAIDWTPLYLATHVDDKVQYLTTAITRLYDVHAPYRTFTPKKKPSPWMNLGLRALIKSRNRAWRAYKRSGRSSDHFLYKQLRNRVKTSTRNAISAYYRLALSNATDCAEMWSLVQSLGLGARNKESAPLPASLEAMNRLFVGDSNPVPLRDTRPTARISPDDRFFFRHVNAEEITNAILSSRSKACGTDGMPMRFLRDCLPHIVPVLLSLFDCSLQSGVFPTAWKCAVVRPIPKRPHPCEVSHFRPISILCAASKLLEATALRQITEYVNSRNLLDPFQSGFRKHHSTQSALLCMVDDFRKAIDDEEIVLLVGIDLTRAFDLVNIQLLIDKLEHFGFSDSACNWVHSFLTNRTQVVSAEGNTSPPISRNCGVPQGSPNGPSFFSLFANDAPSCLRFCSHHLYADDTTIYLSGHVSDVDIIVSRVNEDLHSLALWAESNGLLINASKTQAMWVGSRRFIDSLRKRRIPSLRINSQIIDYCDSMKLLGITIDSTLAWTSQTTMTKNKCQAALARLRKCQDSIPQSIKLLLVKALVFPYLDYCAALFLDLSGELTLKLHRCKNAALRFALGLRKSEHITGAYKALEILPYVTRRDCLCVCLLAAVVQHQQPCYLATHLQFRDPLRTGSKRACGMDLTIAWARTSCYQHSFRVGASRIWNSLPSDLRLAFERPCFKERVRAYFYHSTFP